MSFNQHHEIMTGAEHRRTQSREEQRKRRQIDQIIHTRMEQSMEYFDLHCFSIDKMEKK